MNWSDEKRIHTVDKAVDKNFFIENKEYRLATGSIQQEKYEEKRRKFPDYKNALELFNRTNGKSGLVTVNEGYYRARLTTWSTIRQEYHRSRLCYRFISFRTRQKQIARYAKQLISSAVSQSKERNNKLILLFGDGSFRPGGSGYAAYANHSFVNWVSGVQLLSRMSLGLVKLVLSTSKNSQHRQRAIAFGCVKQIPKCPTHLVYSR